MCNENIHWYSASASSLQRRCQAGRKSVTKPNAAAEGEPIPADLDRDFDLMMRRAGIEVPDERRQGAVAVYRDLMRAAALVHVERSPGQWTAHAYRIETIARARDERK